jgi:hypothetical protein
MEAAMVSFDLMFHFETARAEWCNTYTIEALGLSRSRTLS